MWSTQRVGRTRSLWPATVVGIYAPTVVYTDHMAKHLVDIDDDALSAARAQLGTETIKETVNQALRRAGQARSKAVTVSLDRLARADLGQRDDAWR
jgi:Arc/MetJ family transcription regulator